MASEDKINPAKKLPVVICVALLDGKPQTGSHVCVPRAMWTGTFEPNKEETDAGRETNETRGQRKR